MAFGTDMVVQMKTNMHSSVHSFCSDPENRSGPETSCTLLWYSQCVFLAAFQHKKLLRNNANRTNPAEPAKKHLPSTSVPAHKGLLLTIVNSS